MKLLYIWIEEFRGIEHQGIVVDNEYAISVGEPEAIRCGNSAESKKAKTPLVDSYGQRIYQRSITWTPNASYSFANDKSPICSISILAGKNAVGKSNILKCFCEQEHGEYRAYFLVFLDEQANCLDIRSKRIHITGKDIIQQKTLSDSGYEKYIIPITDFVPSSGNGSNDNVRLFFLTSQKGVPFYTGYEIMDLYTVMAGLDSFDNRNSFLGAFDFFCHFPASTDQHNKLVFFLTEHSDNKQLDYFTQPGYSGEAYKTFFIRKLSDVLFSNLRKWLYHRPPQFMATGRRIALPDEEALKKEDEQLRELTAFAAGLYLQESGGEHISIINNSIPEEKINSVLKFLENNLAASKNGRYRAYIASIRHLFEILYTADSGLFTAFYKLEVPLEAPYRSIVFALQDCFYFNGSDINWMYGTDIRFEWLSAGEFRLAMLFAAIYQQTNEHNEEPQAKDILWLIDEPEMHMHPELCRSFLDELDNAMRQFQAVGLLRSCQLLLTTHSPFIVQNSQKKENTILSLVEKLGNHTIINDFLTLPDLRFPGQKDLSLSLILYKIFDMPTVELHNELYGRLQRIANISNIRPFDRYLSSKGLHQDRPWIEEKNGIAKKPYDVTLQTYIRNSIDHSDNDFNNPYTDSDIRKSIDEMIELLKKVSMQSS